jgi:hypothetical protein
MGRAHFPGMEGPLADLNLFGIPLKPSRLQNDRLGASAASVSLNFRFAVITPDPDPSAAAQNAVANRAAIA